MAAASGPIFAICPHRETSDPYGTWFLAHRVRTHSASMLLVPYGLCADPMQIVCRPCGDCVTAWILDYVSRLCRPIQRMYDKELVNHIAHAYA